MFPPIIVVNPSRNTPMLANHSTASIHPFSLPHDIASTVAECSNSTTDDTGSVMNVACGNYWLDTVDGVQSYTDVYRRSNELDGGGSGNHLYEGKYCYGATFMYMQGFMGKDDLRGIPLLHCHWLHAY